MIADIPLLPILAKLAEGLLATLALYRGMAEGISQSRSVRGYPDWFYQLGQGDLFGMHAGQVICLAHRLQHALQGDQLHLPHRTSVA